MYVDLTNLVATECAVLSGVTVEPLRRIVPIVARAIAGLILLSLPLAQRRKV